jgi:hypothetical protein
MAIVTPTEVEEAAKKERPSEGAGQDLCGLDDQDHPRHEDAGCIEVVKLFLPGGGVRWLAFRRTMDSVPPGSARWVPKLKWWCPISNVYQDEKPAPIRRQHTPTVSVLYRVTKVQRL